MRWVLCAVGFALPVGALASVASAETIAIVMVCAKGTKCNEQTARSVYHVPLQGMICFVPIQQELAKMSVYDEKTDDLKIKCQTKN